MHKFINFFEDLYLNRYELVIQKIANENIPCGLFMPLYPADEKRNIIKQLRDNGIRVEILFTIDKSDLSDPPEGIMVVPLFQISKCRSFCLCKIF